jgi:ATP-binding cassette subfamily B multidrug efflux pump
MPRLWHYLARYRARLLAGVACLFLTTTLTMSVPWLFRSAVVAIQTDRDLGSLGRIVGLLAAIAVAQGVVRTFSRFLIFNVGRDVEYDLRSDLFVHLERLPVAYYQRQQVGDLMSRLVNDVNAVRLLLGPGLLNLINTPLYYAYALTIMLSIDWRLTLATLAVYPAGLVFVKRVSRLLMERTLEVQEGLAELSARAQENLAGMHVVKAYAAAGHEVADFTERNRRFQEVNLRLARVRGFIGPVMTIVGGSGTLVVLWYGGTRVVAGALGIGDLVAFIGYLHVLAWPTMALGWMLSIYQRGRAAMQRLDAVFGAEPAIHDAPDAAPPAAFRGEIAFEGVRFRYPGRRGAPVLDGIDLRVPAGSTVAVVGRTGAGKTSLVQLVPRLFDVEAGRVTIDGVDVRDLPLGWLRRHVGLVPQDPFLFSRSIRDNVAFAAPDAAPERIAWAVEAAALERDLAEMPQGLETIVGERGVTLSGGQKQRATLARVLVADPPILLLDDALSSVDTGTERAILEELGGVVAGRTTMVVAHRLTTVQRADRIVVLEDGRVVEEGTHEALLARDGVYADLFRRQALAGELEAV